MSLYAMEYKNQFMDCIIKSIDVPIGKVIKLHELDIEFIQDEIADNENTSGELTVITDDFGVIDITWYLKIV